MFKARENSCSKAPSDLLVCFPSRSHLTLLPKPMCSPSRPSSEPIKRHLKRLNTRSSIGPATPLQWSKNNQIRGGSSEPTSPKVTCAGQIKVVRPRSVSACRNWQSVMEEIERIHNRAKHKKKSSPSSSSWVETLGFKKDVMSFLTCLRNIRFDFRCSGSFPDQDLPSDEDEDDVDYEDCFKEAEDDDHDNDNNSSENNAVFSKWFMVLQENNQGTTKKVKQACSEDGKDDSTPAAPPPNALLLMRCRSAPAKSWLEETESEEKENKEEYNHNAGEMVKGEVITKAVEVEEEVKEETKKKKRETLAIVMKYDTDFYNLSTDIAQETWVVGGFNNHFSRSRSWRR